jgi:DNA-directed RNA polymerase subunit omega
VYKLRKHVEQVDDGAEDDEEVGDDFESLYKGEISKSGTPILPSKRARKAPEKIQVSKEDLAELSQTSNPDIEAAVNDEGISENSDVSLDEVTESENQQETAEETNSEDNDPSNS